MESEQLPAVVTLSDDSADEGHERPNRKRKADHLSLGPEVHLRATLGKRCSCKNACMDKFAGKMAFQSLLVFRKTWRELHKLDQDSVVPGLIYASLPARFFGIYHKMMMLLFCLIFPRFSIINSDYRLLTCACLSLTDRLSVLQSGAQVFQSMRDRNIAQQKGWKLLGKPVCLKAWKRLHGIGCLPFLKEGFHKGPFSLGWCYCVLFCYSSDLLCKFV